MTWNELIERIMKIIPESERSKPVVVDVDDQKLEIGEISGDPWDGFFLKK